MDQFWHRSNYSSANSPKRPAGNGEPPRPLDQNSYCHGIYFLGPETADWAASSPDTNNRRVNNSPAEDQRAPVNTGAFAFLTGQN